ncbi:MAG: hypothetical protein JW776_12440 [Candidatus Lokiarchaeota archaeon]|nr:hypothetical protein [Candidatus Lokiarchaeota archaeon]
MGKENEDDYVPKYINLEAILKMLLEKLNLEIDSNAKNLVAIYFDKAIEKAAAELSTKFR